MVEIKSRISFDEYMTIINTVSQNCFPDDTYSPAYYEIMFRYALIQMFAPDYDIPKISEISYNNVWDKVTNEEANEILGVIRDTNMYYDLKYAIDNAIDYRIKMSAASPMSMADMALANLIDVFAEQIKKIPNVPQETANKVMQNIAGLNANSFAKDMYHAMVEDGAFDKNKDNGDNNELS